MVVRRVNGDRQEPGDCLGDLWAGFVGDEVADVGVADDRDVGERVLEAPDEAIRPASTAT